MDAPCDPKHALGSGRNIPVHVYRDVTERIKCAKQFSGMQQEKNNPLHALHLDISRRYANPKLRHVELVQDMLCQSQDSPLFALATFLDRADDRLCRVESTLVLFLNLRTALQHCILQSEQNLEQLCFLLNRELPLKLALMGVVGSGSAAIFLLNFTHDANFRTSVLAMWTNDQFLKTLFSHGMDLERYLDLSAVDGSFQDNLVSCAESPTNDFAVALDLLIGTYDALMFFYANTKEKSRFARILFREGSALAERWSMIHPCTEHFPVSVKKHLIRIAKNDVELHNPVSWITCCRLQAYIEDSGNVFLNGGPAKSIVKNYGSVSFFANAKSITYNSETCYLDFTNISFPGREKVMCACCGKVVSAYKSTQANNLYFCSVVDERKRAGKLDNISSCAGALTDPTVRNTDEIVAFMQPNVSTDSPREFVIEIMRRVFGTEQAGMSFGVNPYFFKLYHETTKWMFTRETRRLPSSFRERMLRVLPNTQDEHFKIVRDLYCFFAHLEFFCRIAFAKNNIIQHLRSLCAKQFQHLACKMIIFFRGGDDDFLTDTGFTVVKDEAEDSLYQVAHRGRLLSPGMGLLYALTQNIPLGFSQHDQSVNETVVLLAARRSILHALFLSVKWRCLAFALLRNTRAMQFFISAATKTKQESLQTFKRNAILMRERRVRLRAALTMYMNVGARRTAFKTWKHAVKRLRENARKKRVRLMRAYFISWKNRTSESQTVAKLELKCKKLLDYTHLIKLYRTFHLWQSIAKLNIRARQKADARKRWHHALNAISFVVYLQKLRRTAWILDFHSQLKKFHAWQAKVGR